MSCFIVSREAIDTLLIAMTSHYKKCCKESGIKYHWKREYKNDELNKFANDLMKWNIESVNYRYDENTPFNFTLYRCGVDYSKEALLKGIKQGCCIRYQCNESLNPKLYDTLDNVIFALCKEVMRMNGLKFFNLKTSEEAEAYVKSLKAYDSLNIWG